jgi:DNA polymerase-4
MNINDTRKIIHIDMDAFYASVEQRDNPEYSGKPVIVGGTPQQRGVVAACSYEARKFGVRSAMPTAKALLLCPRAIVLPPRFGAYEHVSRQINRIFREYTTLVEPLSLDEAFLDVTINRRNQPSATRIAVEIKKRIKERTSLTASAGVSYNKFLAKVASGYKKPDGLTVVTPQQAQDFIDGLDIGQFYGVGRVTEQKMQKLGIKNGADLRKKDRAWLKGHFGKAGDFFYGLARGEDDRPVETGWERKSYGRETTFPKDINDLEEIKKNLAEISWEIGEWIKNGGWPARTVTLKIKYFDFKNVTRSVTLGEPVSTPAAIMDEAAKLLKKTDAGRVKIRLAGISLSNFAREGQQKENKGQLDLPF